MALALSLLQVHGAMNDSKAFGLPFHSSGSYKQINK